LLSLALPLIQVTSIIKKSLSSTAEKKQQISDWYARYGTSYNIGMADVSSMDLNGGEFIHRLFDRHAPTEDSFANYPEYCRCMCTFDFEFVRVHIMT
jgi:hypothetical protein